MSYGRAVALLGIAIGLSGCATRHYRPTPISPEAQAAALEARSLSSAGLQHFIESNVAHRLESWPPKRWDPAILTLATLYFHPDLNVSRSGVKVAEAAIVTAGARPNPSFDITPGGSTSIESPWLFGATVNLPIVTAGKRGYQIAAAQHRAEAARLDLAETAWQVRARLRSALLDLLIGEQKVDLLRQEEQVRQEMVRLIDRRVTAGELSSPELNTARTDLLNVKVQARLAEGQLQEARVALANAIGIPESALDGAQFVWPDLDPPPSSESLAPAQIKRAAVLNRLDLRSLLAEYAAAESALQLEIAKQYPDIQLGPGYAFEEAHNNFTLGLSATLPLFNRNQGPIAEGEAKREQAGAKLLALQAQIIGQSQKSLAAYNAALAQLREADQLMQNQREGERLAARAFDVGDSDKLAFTGAQLQVAITARARLDALRSAQQALGDLENAVERPLQTSWEVGGLPGSTNSSTELVKEGPK